MRKTTRACALALAVLLGATPLTYPLSAYATNASDQVIVYDAVADDSATSDQTIWYGDDAVASKEDASAAGETTVDADASVSADDSAADAAATADSDSATGVATDSTAATSSVAEEDLGVNENSWRYENGVLIASGDEGIDAQSLADNLPAGAYARGIDVSSHNGKIDWEAVKAAGIKFAIVRVGAWRTKGDPTWYRDSCFEYNASECERLGIPYGVYYYSYARTTSEALAEAERTLSFLDGHRPQLPVYVDIEDDWINPNNLVISKETLTSNINTFCNRIKAAGFIAGIYSSTSWYKNYLDDTSLRQWDFWVAQWWDHCTYYSSPYSLWQYSSDGSVDGIDGRVDMDYSYNFQWLTNSSTTVALQAHVSNNGWQACTLGEAGTVGSSNGIEALNFSVLNNPGGTIQCSAHVQDEGWQDYTTGTAGTAGKSRRIEAVKFKLTGILASKYDVYYRVYCENYGWTGWAKNGDAAGTEGCSYRIESVQVKLVNKGGAAPGSTDNAHFSGPTTAVSVKAHVSDYGWQDWDVARGGTTGQSKAVEALNFSVANNPGGSVQCSAHVSNVGWQDYTTGMAGTTGKSQQIEAVKLKLTGALAEKYDVYYRVHCADYGWLGWAKNGEAAGSEGYGKRVEAIEVRLVAKGGAAPGSTSDCFRKAPAEVSVQAHVANIGWQGFTTGIAGTTGRSLAIEALNFSVTNNPGGSVQCAAHVANIGWQSFTSGTAGTTGRGLQMEAVKIKLTGALAEHYDVYYRVHSADFGWLGWAKNGEEAGTQGYGKRAEAIEVRLVAKGGAAPGSTTNHFKKS